MTFEQRFGGDEGMRYEAVWRKRVQGRGHTSAEAPMQWCARMFEEQGNQSLVNESWDGRRRSEGQ